MSETILNLSLESDGDDFFSGLFRAEALKRRRALAHSWAYDQTMMEKSPTDYVFHYPNPIMVRSLGLDGNFFNLVAPGLTPNTIINLDVTSTTFRIDVTGEVLDDLRAEIALWRARFPELAAPASEEKIRVTFWMDGAQGPKGVKRVIDAPAWGKIAANYPSAISPALQTLMTDYRPDGNAKLILWHGIPGCGKTYAIRALAREWRHWASMSVIVDPDAFFSRSEYMMGVILRDDGSDSVMDVDADGKVQTRERWHLLVMEDAGELLGRDAREKTGQGLSRLLNVADGMIGQGLRLMILITTNEDLGKLHPAVMRPGRCAAVMQFPAFTPSESVAWLDAHGVPVTVSRDQSLADLYNVLNASKQIKTEAEPAVMGFRGER